MNKALVIGVTGMVGSHMADFLIGKGYKVYGTTRDRGNVYQHNIPEQVELLKMDLTNTEDIYRTIESIQPDEIYNFGGVSFSPNSWVTPEYTGDINGLGVLRLLEAIKTVNPNIKLYQASSSEMYGNIQNTTTSIDEVTYFNPKTPYGIAKVYAHLTVKNYRENYGLFACSGITFNHESERRGLNFVTKKITSGVASISKGELDFIELGNLDVARDWGYAPDFVEGMWLMLQHDKPDDYILATNKLHTLEDFLQIAFNTVGITDYKPYIKINPLYVRNAELKGLQGNYDKLKNTTGWSPKTSFELMIKKMVTYDIRK